MLRTTVLSLLIASVFTRPIGALPPTEKPLPPREAAAAMKVPEGFQVTLFAGEPDVAQPIAMCFDDRGRLWVAECHSYPNWIKDGKPGNDRILIFEDTDNDGTFDKRTVFMDKLANLTSIEFGFGGIYALTAPTLIHIPLDTKTDRPAGEPKVLLDGWNLDIRHNIVNGLKWGPDGWLYGCHGILATSHVGKPGTPKEKRPPINCGVWRFHPITQKYEVVAHGGTNPWGIDWDEDGELYFTNCVIDHAFHVVPGGHYQRMYGSDFNPHLYKLMGSAVDHLHWGGGPWTSSRGGDGKHSEAGGGHAHSGCMIYLGDNFPREYRNNLFTGNIHGNRINRDRINQTAKGPSLSHEKDFLFGNDPWFRPLALAQGLDGSVFVIDWTDTGECHNYVEAHKTSGRIYKVVYGRPQSKSRDLAELSDQDLVRIHFEVDLAVVRRARRILLERSVTRQRSFDDFKSMMGACVKNYLAHGAGRAGVLESAAREMTQTLYTLDLVDNRLLIEDLLRDDNRAALPGIIPWAFARLARENDDALGTALQKVAVDHCERTTGDRAVRLKIASGLRLLPLATRLQIARPLLEQDVDRDDTSMALLLWYALESLPADGRDATLSVDFVTRSGIPLFREFLARRIASLPEPTQADAGIDRLLNGIARCDMDIQRDALAGIQAALQGRRQIPMPANWNVASASFEKSSSSEVRDRSNALGLIFGSLKALAETRAVVVDPNADLTRRQAALQALVFRQPDGLRALLGELLDDDALRAPAIRALASLNDDAIGPRLIALYPKLSRAERSDAIGVLSSRPNFALALLDAVADKKIDRKELGPLEIRQLTSLKDAKVTARVEDVWGTFRPTLKDKLALMAKYKKLLAADELKSADHAQGRLLFTKHCATCHRLFGEGAAIAPDITGSQRANLDYLLENILDPSAVVPREYRVHIISTTAGRTLTGILKEESDRAVTMQTANELVVIPKAEIEQRTASTQSMMPDGVLEQMSLDDARALFAYLGRATPLPK